jgi:AAA15 family ATPase/GTPase
MKITIKHCNNIDEAEIIIELGRLNIKYGPNGTGKSTIAKAIELNSNSKTNLSSLKPFKYRGTSELNQYSPIIQGADDFKSVAVFNEEYVNQFVFKQDEVVRNSFDIFIRTGEYEKKMEEIDRLVSDISLYRKLNLNLFS